MFSAIDAIEYIKELDDQQLEEVDVIDLVELPPEKVDDVSDEEGCVDKEEIGSENDIVSVPGFLEITCAAADITPCTSKNDDNLLKVAKLKKNNQTQKWSKLYGTNLKISRIVLFLAILLFNVFAEATH